jgi:Zn-dependent peptidase ImmA (M78 family)/transcriptional regulator with XRE-family HTH domain
MIDTSLASSTAVFAVNRAPESRVATAIWSAAIRLGYYCSVAFDLGQFGTKLHRLRSEQQLELLELSVGSGIPSDRLAALETGTAGPSGDEVLILADFFKCDYRFLVSNERLAATEQTESLYRRYGTEFTKSDRRAVLEFLYLCECEQMLQQDLEVPRRPFSFVPKGTFYKEHADLAAEALRAHFSYSPHAVPSDVYGDFRKIGFHVFRRRLENSNISGITIRHPFAGICILVNYDEDIYRQRFTAAHETAHGIFDGATDVIVSFSGTYKKEDLIEVRANHFAARYLLPPSVVNAIPVSRWNRQTVLEWAGRFKVSTRALTIALQDAHQIDEKTASALSKVSVPSSEKVDPELANLSEGAAARKRELFQRGLSSSYVALCFEAFDRGLISGGRAAEMLLIDQLELVDLASLYRINLQSR